MKTTMMGSGVLVALAVAAMGVAACDRTEKAGETTTTSATTPAPVEATPASAPPSDDSLAGGDSAKDAGRTAPVGAPARHATKGGIPVGTANDGTVPGRIHDRNLSPTPTPVHPAAQPNSVDNSVGPGHITTPALPDDHRATGAPNSDGSHNIGTSH